MKLSGVSRSSPYPFSKNTKPNRDMNLRGAIRRIASECAAANVLTSLSAAILSFLRSESPKSNVPRPGAVVRLSISRGLLRLLRLV